MRFHIRKESVLKFNRTIICVCWYLDFILEKTPVGKKVIKPNEIEHLFEAKFRNYFLSQGPEWIPQQRFIKWIPLFHFYFRPWFGNVTNALMRKDSPSIARMLCFLIFSTIPSTKFEMKKQMIAQF